MVTAYDVYFHTVLLGKSVSKAAHDLHTEEDTVNGLLQQIKNNTPCRSKYKHNVKVGDKFKFGGHTYKVINLYGCFALCDCGLWKEGFTYSDIDAIRTGRYRESERGKADGECKNRRVKE